MSIPFAVRRFESHDAEAVRAIIERAAADGELVGFNRSEIREWLQLVPEEGEKTFVAVQSGNVIGFCSVANDAVIVSPPHRRSGVGRALVGAAVTGHPELEISQWSGSPGTAAFLTSVGFRLHHHLLRLLRTSSTMPPPLRPTPGFERIGYRHELFDDYVSLVNQSFLDHPTPLHLDAAQIKAVHQRPGFDPDSIALIVREGDPHQPVAFVRLRHVEAEDGTRRGAIALLGVLPDYRGRGFARHLLRWAITRFIEAGITEIELEVVTGNDRALPLYSSESFEQVQAWPYWVHGTIQSS
jgi:mycothiol synthase